MYGKKRFSLYPWELALLTALCVTLCAGLWAGAQQQGLSDELIRLHVVANSDSPDDQAQKLQTRDRVLEILAPALAACTDRDNAVDIINAHLPELEALGTSVSLTEEYYPARRYPTFSLPAGRYLSLRVVLGEGAGLNWWCVIYPPLCTEALAEPADDDVFLPLDGEQAALITQQDGEYELRFRVVDWWERLMHALGA